VSRETGFTTAQRQIVMFRDFELCALCHRRATVVNHRANRGAGGFKGANRLSNACALCWSCNDLIERDPALAAEARRLGIKLSRYDDPAVIRFLHPAFGLWVLLQDDGDYTFEANG
jgi:hypothetical protein